VRRPWLLWLALAVAAVACWLVAARAPAYERADWRHWIDADGDCRDTRQEVLARDAFLGTVVWDAAGCRVVQGRWMDPYSDEHITDPARLDVDHVVPLAWAAAHGGEVWSPARKEAFANELGYRGALVATTARMNRQKGAKGPAEWIPPRDGYTACEYGTAWSIMVTLYDLRLETAERDAIRLLVSKC
jgi:hypothetical protein